MKHLHRFTCVLGGAVFAALVACAPQHVPSSGLTIVVAHGRFPDAGVAAAAESSVSWTDSDRTDDDACTESYAARELVTFLRRCRGVGERALTWSSTAQLPATGDVVVLGNPRSQPLLASLLGRRLPDSTVAGSFRLRALRRGGRNLWVIAGADRAGTLYGTYALLELLGVRFYGPADSETVVPRGAVELPTRLDVSSAPAYALRGFWAWEARGDSAFLTWMARRRLNQWTAVEHDVPRLRKLGIRLAGGGHTLQSDLLDPQAMVPGGTQSYFAAHPEWYGLHEGRRSPQLLLDRGDNLCTSNGAAVAELGRNLVRSLREGALREADLVHVWPVDGGRWCECADCAALGTPSDRALRLASELRHAIVTARRSGSLSRDVVVSAAAYLETTAAPTRPADSDPRDGGMLVTFFPYFRCYAHALDDPTCLEMNRRLQSSWEGWASGAARNYRGRLGVGEYYNVSWFKSLPLVFPHVMAHDIERYHQDGAAAFMYMHVPTSRWGPWRLDHLVLSESLWSPGVNVDSLIADYCDRAYPTASAPMRRHLLALETASANIFAIELSVGGVFGVAGHPGGRLSVRDMPLLPYAHLPFVAPAAGDRNRAPSWEETVSAMSAAREALDEARRTAREPGEIARLEDDAARFHYGELTFALYDRLLRLARAERGDGRLGVRDALREADSLAATLRAVRDLVQSSGSHANAKDGLDASHVAPALAHFHAVFRGR